MEIGHHRREIDGRPYIRNGGIDPSSSRGDQTADMQRSNVARITAKNALAGRRRLRRAPRPKMYKRVINRVHLAHRSVRSPGRRIGWARRF